jgi:hypothetical protein
MSSRACSSDQHRALDERGPAQRSGQRVTLIAAETVASADSLRLVFRAKTCSLSPVEPCSRVERYREAASCVFLRSPSFRFAPRKNSPKRENKLWTCLL